MLKHLSRETLIQICVILVILFASCCYNLIGIILPKEVEQIILFGLSGILFCSMLYLLNSQDKLWKKFVLSFIFAILYKFILNLFCYNW